MIHYVIHAVPTPGQTSALAQSVPTYQKLVSKHGAESVQSFVVSAGPNVGSIMHIVGYESGAAAENGREALFEDPDWKAMQDATGSKIANLTVGTLQELS